MRKVVQYGRLSAALLSVVLLAGCAFGAREATLIYPPARDTGEAQAAAIPGKVEPRKVQIIVNNFTDGRTDKKLVGTVRNAYGMRTADVIPVNSVTEWVTQAVRTDLKNNGYTVASGPLSGSAPAGAAVITGDILNVFCDMYFSYTGQVSLLTSISKDGKELTNKHYSGEGSAGIAWGGTSESFAQSLALALSSAIRQLVSDLEKSLSPQ